jgi:hypothetical protein
MLVNIPYMEHMGMAKENHGYVKNYRRGPGV